MNQEDNLATLLNNLREFVRVKEREFEDYYREGNDFSSPDTTLTAIFRNSLGYIGVDRYSQTKTVYSAVQLEEILNDEKLIWNQGMVNDFKRQVGLIRKEVEEYVDDYKRNNPVVDQDPELE